MILFMQSWKLKPVGLVVFYYLNVLLFGPALTLKMIWPMDSEVHHMEKALVVVFTVLPGGFSDGSALVAVHSFG